MILPLEGTLPTLGRCNIQTNYREFEVEHSRNNRLRRAYWSPDYVDLLDGEFYFKKGKDKLVICDPPKNEGSLSRTAKVES